MKKNIMEDIAGPLWAATLLLAVFSLVLNRCARLTEKTPSASFGDTFSLSGTVHREIPDKTTKKTSYEKLAVSDPPRKVTPLYNTTRGRSGIIDQDANLSIIIGKPVPAILKPLDNTAGGLPSVINPAFYTALTVSAGAGFAELTLWSDSEPLEQRKTAGGKREFIVYVYVEADTVITGKGTALDSLQFDDLNLQLRKGWNAIHAGISARGCSITTGDPEGLKWVKGKAAGDF
jgi:hypothetical protein